VAKVTGASYRFGVEAMQPLQKVIMPEKTIIPESSAVKIFRWFNQGAYFVVKPTEAPERVAKSLFAAHGRQWFSKS